MKMDREQIRLNEIRSRFAGADGVDLSRLAVERPRLLSFNFASLAYLAVKPGSFFDSRNENGSGANPLNEIRSRFAGADGVDLSRLAVERPRLLSFNFASLAYLAVKPGSFFDSRNENGSGANPLLSSDFNSALLPGCNLTYLHLRRMVSKTPFKGAIFMRRWKFTLLAISLLSVALNAQTVDQIIAKNIQAHGGLARLKAIQSMKMTGDFEAGGMQAGFTQVYKRPMKLRLDVSIQGLTLIQAYDGQNGWQVVPFTGKKDPEAMAA